MKIEGGFCPRFHKAVELIGRRWTGAIIRVLLSGPARFTELAAAVPGLSDRLLSERLRELEDEAIVERVDTGGHEAYALTKKGRELTPVLDSLGQWAERWIAFEPATRSASRRAS